MWVCLDDTLIFSNNEIDHINHLLLLLFSEKCKKHKILLFKRKSEIMKLRIEFLRLIIDEIGIGIQPYISKKIYLFLNKLESKELI